MKLYIVGSEMHSIYNLDPAYYITMPSLALECALKYTDIRLECISDPTMYNFIESGIRGGVSMITKRYAKANNKDMKNYDPNFPSFYIIYLDANNLYGYVMCQSLPIGNFHWIPVENFNIDEDCIVDVDLSIPKYLHKKFKDFPMCPKKEKDRLLCTLYPKKNYVCHSRYLKNILSHGYKLEKVNSLSKLFKDIC